MSTTARATLDGLVRTEGKAESIGGRIVHPTGTGFLPSRAAVRSALVPVRETFEPADLDNPLHYP